MRNLDVRRILPAAAIVLAAAATAGPATTLSDVQAVALDAHHLRLIVRASAPLAFDPVPGAGALGVRFYNATLGVIALPGAAPCASGTSLTQAAPGSVMLQLTGIAATCQVTVTQGKNPNTVEIRMSY